MKEFFKKAFNIIFIITIIYLIYNMYIYKLNVPYNKTILYIISILYILIMTLIFKNKSKINIKKYMFILFGIIILILQIVSAHLFKVIPTWDFGIVYTEAIDFSENVNSINYFCMYPNNIPILILLKSIFHIFSILNIKQYINIGIAVNIIAIDVAILMLVLVVKEILGKEKAFFALFFISLMPIIYLAVPIFYTDTLSMTFTIMVLYLYIKLKKQQSMKKKIIYSILLGIITVIGMNIKVTVGIIFIAILIYEIILNKKTNFTFYSLLSFVTVLIIIILEVLVFKYLFKCNDKLYNESLPITHYIMMALDHNGMYNVKDEKFTASFETREEKIKANIEEINKRLEKYNTLEKKIKFVTKKELIIWNDGTYGMPALLNRGRINVGKIQDLIYKENDIYIYISQIQRVSMILLILVSSFCVEKRNKEQYEEKSENELKEAINIISRMSILGLIIFFSFWEIRSRYIINYIPIFTLIEILGIEILDKKTAKIIERKKFK